MYVHVTVLIDGSTYIYPATCGRVVVQLHWPSHVCMRFRLQEFYNNIAML